MNQFLSSKFKHKCFLVYFYGQICAFVLLKTNLFKKLVWEEELSYRETQLQFKSKW